MRVAGTPDVDWFLESGRLAADSIAEILERAGRPLEQVSALLDFGCGCGRVVRHWASLAGEVHGTDANPELVDWCRRNLPFARFQANGLEPPLAYEDSAFDLVYALSVLTHLPETLQHAWMAELRRILEPGGHLLLSIHGEAYAGRLSAAELKRFRAGEVVVRWEQVAGTNLCTAFHPEQYVRRRLADGFELVELVPRGARGNPDQDLVLLRRA